MTHRKSGILRKNMRFNIHLLLYFEYTVHKSTLLKSDVIHFVQLQVIETDYTNSLNLVKSIAAVNQEVKTVFVISLI